VSFFVKAAERGFCLVGLSGGGLTETLVGVNLSTGASVSTLNSPTATTITQLRNGWFRISLTKAATATAAMTARCYVSQDGQQANRSYLGDGASGIFVWGGQIEAGAFPTSYIQTVAAQATRLADVASISGSNVLDFIKPAEGTLKVDINSIASRTSDCTFLRLDDGTSSNRVNIGTGASFTILNAFVIASGVAQGNNTVSVLPSNINKCAFAFATNNTVSSANGTTGTTDTTATIPTMFNRMLLGRDDIAGFINGTIGRIMYLPRRITNTEITAFTS
jgi:hypothetical protein